MRAIVGLWRWRNNPLCRRSDRGEAWLALGAMILVVVVAPLVGWLGASAAHSALMQNAEKQQRERHQVWATAESVHDRAPLGSDPESGSQSADRRHVVAHWAGPDGTSHKSTVVTRQSVQSGERFQIWTDDDGRAARSPMSEHTASSQAALAGLAAGTGTAAALEAVRRLTMRQLLRRRYALWDSEWSRIGPDWGRTGSSS